MKFNIPKKFNIGSVEYSVNIVQHCGLSENFGFWKPQGIIEIAKQSEGFELSESKMKQSFIHELTHAILFQMGEDKLNDNEKFVNVFSSFLTEAINTMED